jgi:hypothetical protein
MSQDSVTALFWNNGANKGYDLLVTLRPSRIEGMEVHRTVWKGIYEKRDAIIPEFRSNLEFTRKTTFGISFNRLFTNIFICRILKSSTLLD